MKNMMRFIRYGTALIALSLSLFTPLSAAPIAAFRSFTYILTVQSRNQPTGQELRERFELGKKQSRNGQYPQALQHFLWLWDLDPQQAGAIRGIRTSILLGEIARIAEVYPPGLSAIQQRIEILERKWVESENRNALSDLFALGTTFKSEVNTLELFDQIDEDSPLRFEFSYYALDELLAAERYDDIIKFHRPLVQLEKTLVVSKRRDAQMKNNPRALQLKARANEYLRSKVTRELHALIAAEKDDDARKYAEMYSAYDSSDEARAAIIEGSKAAGRPNFFEGQ